MALSEINKNAPIHMIDGEAFITLSIPLISALILIDKKEILLDNIKDIQVNAPLSPYIDQFHSDVKIITDAVEETKFYDRESFVKFIIQKLRCEKLRAEIISMSIFACIPK